MRNTGRVAVEVHSPREEGCMRALMFLITIMLAWVIAAHAETWQATYYDSCLKCCGKADGITASGVKAHAGTVACNWLPFKTRLLIDGKSYIVEDRGAKSIFGDRKHHKKRVDIWTEHHSEALKYGRKKVDVQIIGGIK